MTEAEMKLLEKKFKLWKECGTFNLWLPAYLKDVVWGPSLQSRSYHFHLIGGQGQRDASPAQY